MTRSEHDPYEAWMLERWDREAAASDRQDSVGGEAVTAPLDRLEALCEAATPGPWRALHEEQYESRVALGDEALAATEVVYDVPTADAEFIAASRAALPALIAIARALERIAEQQPATLETLRSNGVVFDGPLGNDPSNWQHVAFSIYTDLCEVDTIARAALDEWAALEGGAA